MLKRLFPKVHARYAASANGALLGDFAVWLVSAGYARDAAHGHVRRLKQALGRMRRQSLQHVVARLRAFLRFCFEQVAVPERLDTIDAPRVYRGELPPRALTWPLVQRLLRSIDRRSRLGWRDYAILHLMAHYGLRPSEIVTLTLGSIEWQAKTVAVKQCKHSSDLV